MGEDCKEDCWIKQQYGCDDCVCKDCYGNCDECEYYQGG